MTKKRFLVWGALLFLTGVTCRGWAAFSLEPLMPDAGHDVIVEQKCYLALRFAKESSLPAPIQVYRNEESPSFFFEQTPAVTLHIFEDLSSILSDQKDHRVTVECFPADRLDAGGLVTFQEGFRKAYVVEEAPMQASAICHALGFDAVSSSQVQQGRLFTAKARLLKLPNGEVQDPHLSLNIFIVKTQDFVYVFALQKGDPFESGRTPFRIAFETRIDKEGQLTASVVFPENRAETQPW